jgi:hypothetical protein
LLLGFVYMLSYDAVGAPLGFTMLAYAMLWRNDPAGQSRDDRADAVPTSGDLPPISAAARLKKQRDAARSLA